MSLVIVWYAGHGHHAEDAAARREESPWYATKVEPSFEDMLVKLRRMLIAARFMPTRRFQPTAEETLEVQQAWAAAAA
jgi:hypothetical protein